MSKLRTGLWLPDTSRDDRMTEEDFARDRAALELAMEEGRREVKGPSGRTYRWKLYPRKPA